MLRLAIAALVFFVAVAFHAWFVAAAVATGLGVFLLLRVWSCKSARSSSTVWSIVAVSGGLGLFCLSFGIYLVAVTGGQRFLGIVVLLVMLIPAIFFLALAWSAAYMTVTGRPSGLGERLGQFFTWADRDVFRKHP